MLDENTKRLLDIFIEIELLNDGMNSIKQQYFKLVYGDTRSGCSHEILFYNTDIYGAVTSDEFAKLQEMDQVERILSTIPSPPDEAKIEKWTENLNTYRQILVRYQDTYDATHRELSPPQNIRR